MKPSMEQWIQQFLSGESGDEKMTDKKRKIILAAVEIFSEKGYASTSTSEIAQRAGVAEGTIFRHYKTKKDLLLSIVAPVITKLIAPFMLRDFMKVLDGNHDSYEQFLRAIFRNRLEFARNNLSLIKILIQEIPFQSDLKENFIQLVTNSVIAKISNVIEQYKQKGMLTGSIPTYSMVRFTATSMLGLIVSMLIIVPDNQWDSEQELEYTIHMIMNGIGAQDRGQAQ